MNDRPSLDPESLVRWARTRGLDLADGIHAIRPAVESLTARLRALGHELTPEAAPPPEFLGAAPPERRP